METDLTLEWKLIAFYIYIAPTDDVGACAHLRHHFHNFWGIRIPYTKAAGDICPDCKGTMLARRKLELGLKLYCRTCGGSGTTPKE